MAQESWKSYQKRRHKATAVKCCWDEVIRDFREKREVLTLRGCGGYGGYGEVITLVRA